MAADLPKTVHIERGLVLALDVSLSTRQVLQLMLEGPLDADARQCVQECMGHLAAVGESIKQLKTKRILSAAQQQGPKH